MSTAWTACRPRGRQGRTPGQLQLEPPPNSAVQSRPAQHLQRAWPAAVRPCRSESWAGAVGNRCAVEVVSGRAPAQDCCVRREGRFVQRPSRRLLLVGTLTCPAARDPSNHADLNKVSRRRAPSGARLQPPTSWVHSAVRCPRLRVPARAIVHFYIPGPPLWWLGADGPYYCVCFHQNGHPAKQRLRLDGCITRPE